MQKNTFQLERSNSLDKKLSFVIPCYNSCESITAVIAGIKALLAEKYSAFSYEIILVNDASPDGTLGVIEQLCIDDSCITGLNLSKNFGQHAALLAGLKEANGDVVVCLDDDGQTPPEEAYKLIDEVLSGHDIAMARYEQKKHGALRNLGSKLNDKMARSLIGKPKDLYLSSFFAMKKYICEQLCQYTFPYPYITGMLIRSTNDIVNVDVAHKAREMGQSGYSMSKLLSLWFRGFTNFSIKPLRIAIVLGCIIAVVGFIVGIYAVVVKLTNPAAVVGWPSMMSAIVFIGGIILIVLGLVGEYIGRIYMGLNQQPQYVVRDKIKNGNKPNE